MGAQPVFGTVGTLFGHSARLSQGRFWLKTRSAYSLASYAPGPTPAFRNPRQVPNTPPCQPVGAARLPLAPALATRAPEAGLSGMGLGEGI